MYSPLIVVFHVIWFLFRLWRCWCSDCCDLDDQPRAFQFSAVSNPACINMWELFENFNFDTPFHLHKSMPMGRPIIDVYLPKSPDLSDTTRSNSNTSNSNITKTISSPSHFQPPQLHEHSYTYTCNPSNTTMATVTCNNFSGYLHENAKKFLSQFDSYSGF